MSTTRPDPRLQTSLAAAFKYQAEVKAEEPALIFGRQIYTYKQLDRISNALAIRLVDTYALAIGSSVGIYLDRSATFVIFALALLKAGCIFVPLDTGLPASRVARLAAKSATRAIITNNNLKAELASNLNESITILMYEKLYMEIEDTTLAFSRYYPTAYCLFTSGTSGEPKGVLIPHDAVLNLIADWQSRLELHPRRCSWWTTVGFDVAIFEIFSALISGSTLVITPERYRYDPQAYFSWLNSLEIESAYISPSFINVLATLPKKLLNLRYLLVGVEPILESKLFSIKSHNPGLKIMNGYGPTEATVYASIFSDIADLRRNTPIGKPIANMELMLLDEHQESVRQGDIGEIYIAGVGVGHGYVGEPELTSARFSKVCINGQSVAAYRTGDFGRMLPCGNMIFVGRADNQAKLNGVRVEFEEIQVAIATYGSIADCAVGVQLFKGKEALVAYIVAVGEQYDTGLLRTHLRKILPSYMVPDHISYLQQLPQTLNGKTDRVKLFGRVVIS